MNVIIYSCENGGFDKHRNAFHNYKFVYETFQYVVFTFVNLIFPHNICRSNPERLQLKFRDHTFSEASGENSPTTKCRATTKKCTKFETTVIPM